MNFCLLSFRTDVYKSAVSICRNIINRHLLTNTTSTADFESTATFDKMFKFALIASLMAVAIAQRYGHGGYGAPAPSYGHQEDYAQPIPYQYGFDIVGGDHHSGDFKQTRQEHGDGHGNVQGSYGYTDAHGNYRQVDYVADHHGFRASVKTNEPGTENQSPADVELHAQPQHGGYAAPRPSYGHY
ncbi:adult-specific rigid cuticular protein 15.5 [Trichonephila clavata]|uniref:Adult-specific rigid cuticular protein 15.5 n=1 Tax=Trichonephila clavata TaxID=2740835 RepID=A0A8X6J166_TRICU|nr:adult-specific rigid cuticular protein 15.5 [Trichonephila clavata]